MAVDMATHCLEAMADGGLFDHLGGGFHRYAVDRSWTVPHFEKMLYDNALLARVYLEAWQATGRAAFRETAVATLDFMRREMRTPEGGFSASLDADSEGEEGRFYLWTQAEVDRAAGDPALQDLFHQVFDLPPGGHLDGRWVLRRPIGRARSSSEPGNETPAALLEDLRARLLAARSERPRPAMDDKVVTAWNGLALSAWCIAAQALGRPQDLTTAQELAALLLSALRPDGQLRRSYRLGQARHAAGLDDHAALAEGLVDLYQTDFDERWLTAALELADSILEDFVDPAGGFFDTGAQPNGLPARPKSLQDTPVPSGNALAVSLLLRLEALTGEKRYREAALPPLLGMQETASRHPTAFPVWLQDLALAASPIPQLAIVGDSSTAAFDMLVREGHRPFLPRLVLAGGDPRKDESLELLRGKVPIEQRPTAYLCHGFACDKPTTSPEELREQLNQAR
jgi:uncharacterized protein YyaL (SSP411 family)